MECPLRFLEPYILNNSLNNNNNNNNNMFDYSTRMIQLVVLPPRYALAMQAIRGSHALDCTYDGSYDLWNIRSRQPKVLVSYQCILRLLV